MIIRQKPNDENKLIKVSESYGLYLQKNNFFPLYMWEDYLYFEKTQEIIDFMKRGGEMNAE